MLVISETRKRRKVYISITQPFAWWHFQVQCSERRRPYRECCLIVKDTELEIVGIVPDVQQIHRIRGIHILFCMNMQNIFWILWCIWHIEPLLPSPHWVLMRKTRGGKQHEHNSAWILYPCYSAFPGKFPAPPPISFFLSLAGFSI